MVRRISKGKVEAREELNLESNETQIDIDAMFTDMFEQRMQEQRNQKGSLRLDIQN